MRLKIRNKIETLPNGTKVIRRKVEAAPELEWRLQAAAVQAVKHMPEYASTADQVAPGAGRFTVAGDMNAARRGRQEQVKAAATGIAAGDPDLRVYFAGGFLGLIEYKARDGRLSQAQKDRHPLLRALGFDVVVIKSETEEHAADATVAQVKAWLCGKRSNGGGE